MRAHQAIAIYIDSNAVAREVHMGRRSNVAFAQRKRYRLIVPEKAKARRLKQRRAHFTYQTILSGCVSLSLELHVEATASRVDSDPLLCGGNADYHAGLI